MIWVWSWSSTSLSTLGSVRLIFGASKMSIKDHSEGAIMKSLSPRVSVVLPSSPCNVNYHNICNVSQSMSGLICCCDSCLTPDRILHAERGKIMQCSEVNMRVKPGSITGDYYRWRVCPVQR